MIVILGMNLIIMDYPSSAVTHSLLVDEQLPRRYADYGVTKVLNVLENK